MRTRETVDLWLAHPEPIRDATLLARYRTLLSDDEQERCDRFMFVRDRHLFLVAHALLRTVVAEKAGGDAKTLAFDVGPHGRLELRPGSAPRSVRFNLAHTHGLVAVAVTSEGDIGVDVEGPREVNLAVADKHFSPSEVRALQALPEGERPGRFLAYWTLKESYIKARGMGLALPLDGFSFDLDPEAEEPFTTRKDLDDRADAWRFQLLHSAPDHRVAVAVRTERELEVVTRSCVPMVSEDRVGLDRLWQV